MDFTTTDSTHSEIIAGPLPCAMTPQGTTVLLVGRAGHVREALLGLIKTLPNLNTIRIAESGLLALGMASELRPNLVLVSSGLPEAEGPELVRQLKLRCPASPCLVLTDNTRQSEKVRQAGASSVLPAGVSSWLLLEAISTLVNHIHQEL